MRRSSMSGHVYLGAPLAPSPPETAQPLAVARVVVHIATSLALLGCELVAWVAARVAAGTQDSPPPATGSHGESHEPDVTVALRDRTGAGSRGGGDLIAEWPLEDLRDVSGWN